MNIGKQNYRVDWVDYAKGICIILVVMMHSTLGVEKALGETGALNAFIEWARGMPGRSAPMGRRWRSLPRVRCFV